MMRKTSPVLSLKDKEATAREVPHIGFDVLNFRTLLKANVRSYRLGLEAFHRAYVDVR